MIGVPNLFSNFSVPCSWGAAPKTPFKPPEDPKVPLLEVMAVCCATSLAFVGTTAEKLRVDVSVFGEDDLNSFGIGIGLGGKEKCKGDSRSRIPRIYTGGVARRQIESGYTAHVMPEGANPHRWSTRQGDPSAHCRIGG